MGRHGGRKKGKQSCPTPDKVGFRSARQAERALMDIWSKPGRVWYPVRWYKCVCQKYHLTRKSVWYD